MSENQFRLLGRKRLITANKNKRFVSKSVILKKRKLDDSLKEAANLFFSNLGEENTRKIIETPIHEESTAISPKQYSVARKNRDMVNLSLTILKQNKKQFHGPFQSLSFANHSLHQGSFKQPPKKHISVADDNKAKTYILGAPKNEEMLKKKQIYQMSSKEYKMQKILPQINMQGESTSQLASSIFESLTLKKNKKRGKRSLKLKKMGNDEQFKTIGNFFQKKTLKSKKFFKKGKKINFNKTMLAKLPQGIDFSNSNFNDFYNPPENARRRGRYFYGQNTHSTWTSGDEHSIKKGSRIKGTTIYDPTLKGSRLKLGSWGNSIRSVRRSGIKSRVQLSHDSMEDPVTRKID